MSSVAPTPAWAGRHLDGRIDVRRRCPHTRLGRTLDPDWDLRVWKGPKSLSVHDWVCSGGTPHGSRCHQVASC